MHPPFTIFFIFGIGSQKHITRMKQKDYENEKIKASSNDIEVYIEVMSQVLILGHVDYECTMLPL